LPALIDLHCHILPGIDDGAADLSVSLAMARASVAAGITVLACTPHILPGVYHNSGPQIRSAVAQLQTVLDQEGIPLHLIAGADVHIVPDFVAGLNSGRLLTLGDTRYVLVEVPHHVAPVRLDDCFFQLMLAGFVPVFTHPERLSWIDGHYANLQRLAQAGVWMQITAGSLIGSFGRRARYWAERMLDEGFVHILASDAHNMNRRPQLLREGREAAAGRVGEEEADRLVLTRPSGIVRNEFSHTLPMPSLVGASVRTASMADSNLPSQKSTWLRPW
jgi:protein-tyrosine phosphatase